MAIINVWITSFESKRNVNWSFIRTYCSIMQHQSQPTLWNGIKFAFAFHLINADFHRIPLFSKYVGIFWRFVLFTADELVQGTVEVNNLY